MNALAVIAEPALPVVFEAELELASDFAKASKSAATLKAYRTDFSIFEAWCRGRGLNALLARCKAVVAFFAVGAAPVRKKAATSDIVLGMAATVGGESLRQLSDRTSRGCHRLGGCAAPRV